MKCNNGTSQSDQVASLLGRVFPDAGTEQQRYEIKKLLRGVSNNVPGLLEEMQIGHIGQKSAQRDIPSMPPGGGVLRANGPILAKHMHKSTIGFVRHRSYVRTATVDKIAQSMGNLAFCAGADAVVVSLHEPLWSTLPQACRLAGKTDIPIFL